MSSDRQTEFQDPLQNYDPPEFTDELERALAEEPVGTIHCSPFAQISPDAPALEAIAKLQELGVGCLLVTEGKRLVGLFTERDVLNRVAENFRKASSLPVRELMTESSISVDESDPAGAALCVMAAFGYRHVPVLDSNRQVVGVVSPQRMLEFLLKYLTVN
jgi:CBS domain-containing protein